jgi:hypothetical protein
MHLKQTYGFINPNQLADNYNKMTALINFQEPIETLLKQIEDVLRYANAGMQPYMVAHYVKIAFLLILNTGAVTDACRDWQRRTPVNQTWADFRWEFARAQREQRIIPIISSGAGYNTTNVAEHYVHSQIPADGGFFTAMANLATIISADHEMVATLNKKIATLTDQLAANDILAKSKEVEIKSLLGLRAPNVAVVTAGPTCAYVRMSYKTKN